MILEYKNNEGYIYAYLTWNIIDKDNKLVEWGETISINGAWVHPKFRHLRVLKNMISDLFHHPTTQKSLYVLTSRSKYNKRPNRLVPIMKYFKYIKGVNNDKRKNRSTTRDYSHSNT